MGRDNMTLASCIGCVHNTETHCKYKDFCKGYSKNFIEFQRFINITFGNKDNKLTSLLEKSRKKIFQESEKEKTKMIKTYKKVA